MRPTQDLTEQILNIPKDLLLRRSRRIPTLEEIDGRFYFEVWDGGWIDWVLETRHSLFGQDAALFSNRIHSAIPTEVLDELEPLVRDRLNEAVQYKCRETGLWQGDVLSHVLMGTPLLLPRIRIVSEPGGVANLWVNQSIRPRAVLLIYADDVKGEEVSGLYQGHMKSALLTKGGSKPKRRIQTSQQPDNLVRTWTVMCLEFKLGMKAREAIKLWNQEFPEYAYAAEVESVTATAEIQYSRDKKKLKERLNLTT